MVSLENEREVSGDQFIEIAYDEIKDYVGFDAIFSIAGEKHLTFWENYLLYIKDGYYPQSNITIDSAIDTWEKIKKLEMPSERIIFLFKDLVSEVYYFAKYGDSEFSEKIVAESENKNWFYNWIIYSVKVAELRAHTAQMNPQCICKTVIAYLELLLQDTEVFKGKPRTCDLYFLKEELTKSYERALELISEYGTLQDLEKALMILERLDDETGTSFDHSMNGPLTDAEFLKLISHFLTVENYEIVKPYLLRIQEKIEQNEVYDSIAAAKLRFVSLISKYNQSEAIVYSDICVRYLVAYGFHKDVILEQIMDSYGIFFKSTAGNLEDERDAITEMTVAVRSHTDGRETKHFLNHWFDILLKTDPRYAIALLSEYQVKLGRSWVVDSMLCSVIEKYCNDSNYLDIIIGLIESLPNDTSPRIIDAATSVFGILEQVHSVTDDNKKLFVECRMRELVANLVSRFNILDNPWSANDSWIDGSIKKFLLAVETAGFDVSQYIDYFHIKEVDETGSDTRKRTADTFGGNQTHFDASTPEEARKWLELHDLTKRDIQYVCQFLENYCDDNNSLLNLLRIIIIKAGKWGYSKECKDTVLQIIEQLQLDDRGKSEVYMLMYLYSYDWGSSLIGKNEFLDSIRLNLDVGRATFYRECPKVIITRSGKITKGLLGALFAIAYNKDSIIKIWKNAFSIMKLRFPQS